MLRKKKSICFSILFSSRAGCLQSFPAVRRPSRLLAKPAALRRSERGEKQTKTTSPITTNQQPTKLATNNGVIDIRRRKGRPSHAPSCRPCDPPRYRRRRYPTRGSLVPSPLGLCSPAPLEPAGGPPPAFALPGRPSSDLAPAAIY